MVKENAATLVTCGLYVLLLTCNLDYYIGSLATVVT